MSSQITSFANVDAVGCPSPFVGEDLFPFKGGWSGSRNCQENILSSNANASRCCLPCPIVDYIYPRDFETFSNGSAWVHVAAFILCSFLLISMIVLPKESRRAYLNLVLLAGVLIFDLGFIIPLAREPPKCFDKITQVSQDDNFTCAISGTFAAFGALFLVVWVLVRALFMHLQICWSIVPGAKSYIAANIAAFSICISLITAVLIRSGVSMKWGHYCHVNLGSNSTYWGWLLAFAGLSFLLQITTFGYVLKVYVSSAVAGANKASISLNSSLKGSSKSRNARATAKRVQKVLLLQWRSLAIVAVAIFTVTFACLIFVINNRRFTKQALANKSEVLLPWIVCLVTTQDTATCLPYIRKLVVSPGLIIAALFVMSFAGIWAFVLLFRVEILHGWWNLLRGRKARQDSEDSFLATIARRHAEQHATRDEKEFEVEEAASGGGGGSLSRSRREPMTDEELGPLQRNPVLPGEAHLK